MSAIEQRASGIDPVFARKGARPKRSLHKSILEIVHHHGITLDALRSAIDDVEAAQTPKTRRKRDLVAAGQTGELQTVDGREVIGTSEVLTGCARIHGATRNPDGSLDLDWAGDTEIDWNAQKTRHRYGERLFVTDDGDEVPESQVRLVRAGS